MNALPAHSQKPDSPQSRGGEPRLSPLAELQILQAWRNGDPQALGTLLRSYQGRMYGVCVRLVGDPETAKDLTQESLVRVIEGLPGYDGRSQLSTWIIRVTMNCCLTFLRKQKVRKHKSLDEMKGEMPDSPVFEPSDSGELSASERVEQSQEREVLVRALDSLDADSRAILVLRDIQALDYQRVSEVLDLPLGTVKSRLFRAREALRAEIERLSPRK